MRWRSGFLAAGLGLVGCADFVGSPAPETVTLDVAPNQAPCRSDPVRQCLLVKFEATSTALWQLLDAPAYEPTIVGFYFTPGRRQRISARSEVTIGAPLFTKRLSTLATLSSEADATPAVPGQP